MKKRSRRGSKFMHAMGEMVGRKYGGPHLSIFWPYRDNLKMCHLIALINGARSTWPPKTILKPFRSNKVNAPSGHNYHVGGAK